jgi:hypothetical protein
MWAAVVLASLFPALASAQTFEHRVYLDLDSNTATGCNVATLAGPVTGAEARVTATVSGQPPFVTAVVRELCAGGVFGSPAAQPAGHAVGLNKYGNEVKWV